MEGVHFVAGPWFTVQPSNADVWHPFGELWLSNGSFDGKARIEIKLWLDEPEDTE
jgi:hypothetical protein